jgi:hypothetical protein
MFSEGLRSYLRQRDSWYVAGISVPCVTWWGVKHPDFLDHVVPIPLGWGKQEQHGAVAVVDRLRKRRRGIQPKVTESCFCRRCDKLAIQVILAAQSQWAKAATTPWTLAANSFKRSSLRR